ncbi:hypothetical protein ED208_01055 [Stagnimonas aquatica]|uniref:YtxH domain-containing protein n=1 Tax=Stagnimonas aquatica TaxID=2689987 RepID=A0A3N0VKB7_9GAMM|nr:hypothetical protein [Stagnimonas aquatica]ROH93151.1 hypothetical protein ED208_01055 [Stagnimonas aquatica]
MNKNIALLLLIAALGATTTACKKEEPSAVEQLEDKVKDGLDLRENEKLKDAGESAADAIKEAGEAAKEAVTPEEKPN